MNYPGKNNKPFRIKFDGEWFYRKGDILVTGQPPTKLIVTRVYKRTWWRRFLSWLGFKTKLFQVKVKELTDGKHT